MINGSNGKVGIYLKLCAACALGKLVKMVKSKCFEKRLRSRPQIVFRNKGGMWVALCKNITFDDLLGSQSLFEIL